MQHKSGKHYRNRFYGIASLLTLLLMGLPCFGIGWQTVSPDNIDDTGIEIAVEFDDYWECHQITLKLPEFFDFEELGIRPFSDINLRSVDSKERGWQLTGKGSKIALKTRREGTHFEVDRLCLTRQELALSHLEVWYDEPQGAPPMIVIIELNEFK